MDRHSLRAAAVTSLAVALVGLAQPATAPHPSTSYVGALTGTAPGAKVAVVIEGEKVLAYVCGTDPEFNAAHAVWLPGTVAAGEVKAAAGTTTLRARVSGTRITGEVTGPDRRTMRFAADRVPAGGDAGVYRSETKLGGEQFVAGWIVDTDDAVAGAIVIRSRGQIIIVTPSAAQAGANLSPQATRVSAAAAQRLGATGNICKLNGLSPEKQGAKQRLAAMVKEKAIAKATEPEKSKDTEPATEDAPPPAPGGAKIDDAVREENRQQRTTRFQVKRGSPYLCVFTHQARRFLAGAEPAAGLETRIAEVLKAVGPDVLKPFVARIDQLPEAERRALMGPLKDVFSPDVPLDDATIAKVAAAIKSRSGKKPPRAAVTSESVKAVTIEKLVCVRETPPSGVGSDDVIVVTAAMAGRSLALKVGEPIRGLDTGATRPIREDDGRAWPPANDTGSTNEEIAIVAGVMEDDSGTPEATTLLLRAYADVIAAVTDTVSPGLLDFDLTDAIGEAFDAVTVGLPSSEFLGTDKAVVTPDGKIASPDGKAKDRFTVRQTGQRGKIKTQYELTEVQVRK